MVVLVYFLESNIKDDYFYRKCDLYGCSSYSNFSKDYFTTFASKFFCDLGCYINNSYYLEKSKHVCAHFQDYRTNSYNYITKYLKFIETVDLESYYNEFVKYQDIDFRKNVFIACFTKKEFDFLNSKHESVNILVKKSSDEYEDIENLFDLIEHDYSNVNRFLNYTIYPTL